MYKKCKSIFDLHRVITKTWFIYCKHNLNKETQIEADVNLS